MKKIVPSLMVAFALAGCAENPQDVARKPEVVSTMVEASADMCQTGPVHADAAAYKARLEHVLMKVRTADLETLQKEKITVCLDQRLAHENTGFWDAHARAVYYNGKGPEGKILSLTDDGKQPEEAGFWHTGYSTAYYRDGEMIRTLAKRIRNGDVAPQGEKMYAGLMGKYNAVYWRAAHKFDQGTIAKNPQLEKPPVKSAFKPGS
ncbi:MAG: hypothetical protein GC185_08560 [Alphaproteobacteria bacterium]|nr:hypothetical protein [Alphaproteobacteria bacterium]